MLKTPDALIVASAITARADLFITNDQRLEFVKEIRTMTMDEIVEEKRVPLICVNI